MTPTLSKEASVGKKHDVGLSGQSRNTIVLAIGTVVVIVAVILGVVFSKRDTSLSADVPAPSPPPTSSDIVAFIRSIALMGGDEFADPFSYQSQALANMKKMDSQNFSEEEMIQRYALACIFIATDAVETIYSDKDPSSWTNSSLWMTTANECLWFGVTCDILGQVTAIDLRMNGMTGSIPNEIVLLRETLSRLDLSHNDVYNEGADLEWMGKLTNLRDLFVGSCFFVYDGIPPFLASLYKMEQMDISYTLFYGPIRGGTFSPMTNLRYLEMGGNEYNTTFPSEIARLPALDSVYIDNSFISGDLSFLDDMHVIYELWLDGNNIAGSIPTSIGERVTLSSISWTGNLLSGAIPTEIGRLTDLTQVWLYDNMLTGTMPTEIGMLDKLELLQVEQNELNGGISQEICFLKEGLLGFLSSDCLSFKVVCTCCDCCAFPCS